tara:strand:+ start:260 stop:604 length:345 start_codon:yes stop_codon:yes gene_type:complete
MKLNFAQTSIAIAISLLIAYGFYSFHDSENKVMLSLGSFIFFATTLVTTIGVSFERPRTTTNIRTVSGIFFIIALFSNLVFSFLTFSIPGYVIVNGMLFLIFSLIVYSINKAKQ